MIWKIKDIANLHTGIYAQPSKNGDIYYVQARHFDKNKRFLEYTKPELLLDDKLTKHFLVPGDILVASKGYDHFAVVYAGKITPAVASSMFIVIRLKTRQYILPDYIAWYINHPGTQKTLSGSSKGTALPSITKQDILNIEVQIPTLEQQKIVLRIDELHQKEKVLISRISELKEKQLFHTILNYL